MSRPAEFQALPHSEESERAVLAAVLLSPGILVQLMEVLEEKDFYIEKNQAVYGAMLALYEDGAPIDLRTVQAKLELRGDLGTVGGLAYLTSLDLFLPAIDRTLDYAKIVKDASSRRHLMHIASDMTAACLGSGKEAKDILAVSERRLAMVWVGESSEWVSAGEAFEESDRIRAQQEDGTLPTFYTGIQAIDDLCGQIEAGELLVIGGNPKMGKSSLARQFLVEFSRRGAVLLATLEETVDQVMPKMACSLAEVSYTDWRLRRLDEEDTAAYWEARRDLSKRDIRLVGLGDPQKRRGRGRRRTWSDIERITRKADRKSKLSAVAVDYIQLLVEGKDTNWELENLSAGFAMLCGELGVVGVSVSQLNQENAKRKHKRDGSAPTWQEHLPQISDLRGSGGISQSAHKIFFPFRPSRFEPHNELYRPVCGLELAKLCLAANRNGDTGIVDVWWRGTTMTYWDGVPGGSYGRN